MLQFNNNHIFTGYLKQFLSSFNLPTCRIYTAEFERYSAKYGKEDPRVIESSLPIVLPSTEQSRAAVGITYLKEGAAQQYFWDTANWNVGAGLTPSNKVVKYWKSDKAVHYNGNKILGLTKTLNNPTTLYNYQTHEYLGDYLRFLRDYENINLMSMYNCFSNRLCNNIKVTLNWEKTYEEENPITQEKEKITEILKTAQINAYDTNYKIYMLPVKLFENYTVAIDCYQGVELFCGLYNERLDITEKGKDLIKKTYTKVPKALFNQPFVYDMLDKKYWSWEAENTIASEDTPESTMTDTTKFLRAELAMRESELKLFIKIPTSNTSSIVVLEGNYLNFNDSLYTQSTKSGWQYFANSTISNFETAKTYKYSTLPNINSREFRPISKLQLLALNTGISYPFADRLVEYLVANVILPNDPTPDNIKRLQKVMEDCGYSFQIDGIWEPKMQMVLYDYLMNNGKFAVEFKKDKAGNFVLDEAKNKIATGKVENQRTGNLRQMGQRMRSDFYDVLGYADKDAEKLYASWVITTNEKTNKKQATAKTTLENVDIYSNLYNN